VPFRLVIVRDAARARLADLFEAYARRAGKDDESCAIERSRALQVPVTLTVVARIDLSHPVVPAHEQWIAVGGAIANVLNALHLLGYAGKMLSGGKVRDQQIVTAFCEPGETLVGWVVLGTPVRAGKPKFQKPLPEALLSDW
jgi:hypothetical protein